MPIVRINTDLIYYAHVPKCAGSAVEDYLAERFGPLAFLDRGHNCIPEARRWSATSPQHLDVEVLDRLFPEGFFKASFAVVRHPASRLRSAFLFKASKGQVNPGAGFERWLRSALKRQKSFPYVEDNHVRPMSEIVPSKARIFQLEDGFGLLVAWLDELEGAETGPRTVAQSNVTKNAKPRGLSRAGRLLFRAFPPKLPTMNERLCRLVYDLYPEDYERFGYGVLDPLEDRN